MKQLVQSTAVLLGITVLVLLTVLNTCQLDKVEQRVIDNSKRLEEIAEKGVISRGGSGGEAAAEAGADWVDQQAQEALKDPANLLKPPLRPMLEASRIAWGGTLRRHTGSDPRGLNPHIANGADATEYNRYVRNRVAGRDRENPGHFIPELAVKVTTPDDGLTYVIQFRKGVYWHEPTVDWDSGRYDWLKGKKELVADDLAFVFDMLENTQVQGRISALRNYFEDFEGYELLDRHTIKLTFSKRLHSTFPQLMDMMPSPRWLYMYDEDGNKFDEATWGQKVNEHWYNQKTLGTGPYTFVSWEPGVKLEFARNDAYWGPRGAFDRVIVQVLKDQNAVPRKLKTGELDLAYLQPEQYRTEVLEADGALLGKDEMKMNMQPTLGYAYIGWNMDTPYFSDKRVRQAMTLAMDRDGIIKNVFHGLGEETSGPFPRQVPCYDPSIKPWPFDPAQAGKLLDEAGWIDTDKDGIRDKVVNGERIPFEFTMLLYGSSNEYATFGNIYRESLLSVGVRMNPRPLEWSTMLKKMDEREFGGYTGIWVMNWETDLVQLWHSKEADNPKGSNRVGFRNERADVIADSLRETFDMDERKALCHEFHALIHEEQPYTFMYQRIRPVLYWDHMNEPVYSLTYPYRDFRYWSFVEERP